ncbi:hypothetical protein FY034_18805 (plasmid) [Trichlorobacter lovleyi]|uniref:hypothetical protein n=1 Tax=Trichlorobacter lovleyi TaxID=313985 RepID=UPI00223FF131|nr:hypothetical protein [Trichlorobacter lovleyi]QOX81028.1 hypothetical protein FY034_18805 [Trichlorobacter lovleyi]
MGFKRLSNLPVNRQKIKDDLLSGAITAKQAGEALSNLPPIWQSAKWKKKRDEIIGNVCAKCGMSEGVMVAQHHWHPRKIRDIMYCLAQDAGVLLEFFIEEERRCAGFEAEADILRECCPKCKSVSVTYRKKAQTWICHGSTGSVMSRRGLRVCGHVFEKPEEIMAPSKQAKRVHAEQKRQVYDKAKARWWAEVEVRFARQAVLISLDESERYLSLVDVKTYCKKCAFKEDKFGWQEELREMITSDPEVAKLLAIKEMYFQTLKQIGNESHS